MRFIKYFWYLKTYLSLSKIVSNWYDIFFQALGINSNPNFTLYLKSGEEFKLTHFKDSPVLSENWQLDIYHLRQLHRPKTIIDIGAYVGDFSIMAAKLFPGSNIYAFEPAPDSYHCLLVNILANSVTNINPFSIAVTDKNGQQQLFDPGPGGQRSLNPTPKSSKPFKVQTQTLSWIFNSLKISTCDLLKMDSEGAEYEILFSTPPDIFKKIKRIALEFHDRPFGDHNGLIELLSRLGYHTLIQYHPVEGDIGMLYAWH